MPLSLRSSVLKGVFLLAIALVAVGVWQTWSFSRQNLRGIGPAIRKPSEDIAKLIDTREVPLQLPEGFSIGVFARDLDAARVLVQDPNGVLLVSVPAEGKVLALPDKNDDRKSDGAVTVIEGLQRPHGLAFRCVDGRCRLYIAEENALAMYEYDTATYQATSRKKMADLPTGGTHWSRSLLFLPSPNDATLLVAIGSSCNACTETDARRAKIYSIPADGGEFKEYARGLRNSVFQTIHPRTKHVWVTEMGRDLLGDDIPPDEINVLEEGKNYGWPICYGKNIHDTVFDKNTYIRNPCMEPFEVPSRVDLQAHSAPLGLAFIPENGWPADMSEDLLVAYHGSWNRTQPTGYKIARVKLNANGEHEGTEDFITGWLRPDGTALGRPVALLFAPNGDLYISDDKAGVVYRVYRTK